MQAILTRRSVRRFIPNKPISKETLLKIIKAGQYAPSAHNKQPWEFLVVEDKKFLEDLPNYQQWTTFAKYGSVAIFILADMEQGYNREGENWNFAEIDCSLAIQNMTLAAHDQGLGSTICGISPMPETIQKFKQLLDLPGHIHPVALLILGHPEGEPKQPETRFNESKIHWDKY